jgi:hypothetical protein
MFRKYRGRAEGTMSITQFSAGSYALAAKEDLSAPRTRIAIPATLRASGGFRLLS